MNLSDFGKLNLADIGKGFITAVLTAIIAYVYQFVSSAVTALQAGQTPQLPDLQSLLTAGLIALGAGFAYLVKNVFTNSNGEIAKTENK